MSKITKKEAEEMLGKYNTSKRNPVSAIIGFGLLIMLMLAIASAIKFFILYLW